LTKLVIIDYQSGNLRSVAKALESTGVRPLITGDPDELGDADGLVLPGVGSGPAAMAALKQRGLVEPLREYVKSGRPFLGVCLGLQLLMERTDEGNASCLDIIPGEVKRLPATLKVPHPRMPRPWPAPPNTAYPSAASTPGTTWWPPSFIRRRAGRWACNFTRTLSTW